MSDQNLHAVRAFGSPEPTATATGADDSGFPRGALRRSSSEGRGDTAPLLRGLNGREDVGVGLDSVEDRGPSES